MCCLFSVATSHTKVAGLFQAGFWRWMELEEETGIVLTGMQLAGVYSDVERDPRGRVITAAYTAMTTMTEATAADDAAAAKWWPLNDLPPLAFDHETILRDAKRVMNIKD